MLTTLAGNSASQSVSAQTIFTSFTPGNDTLNVREGNRTTLPSQEGFSVRSLSTNFSAPHNVLYGPDNVLWITERVGKTITRVDPNNGSKLNSMPVPDIHQSGGQDGLMGMAFDLAYNNTHHIYVAYTYDADPGEPLERHTKITRFTYDPMTKSIGEPLDLISGLSGSIDHNSENGLWY
jgi:glucose/arabinose dehydrogenase